MTGPERTEPSGYARNPITGQWMEVTFTSATRVGGHLIVPAGFIDGRYVEWPRVNFAEFAAEPSMAVERVKVKS